MCEKNSEKINEYQEALDELSYPLPDSSCGGSKCGESDCHCEKSEAVKTLRKIVEKSTPMKVILVSNYDGRLVVACPRCREEFEPNRFLHYVNWEGCPYCLQKIDFTDVECPEAAK